MTTPPGWYHAEGDPQNTNRWWDGAQWIGDAQLAAREVTSVGAAQVPAMAPAPALTAVTPAEAVTPAQGGPEAEPAGATGSFFDIPADGHFGLAPAPSGPDPLAPAQPSNASASSTQKPSPIYWMTLPLKRYADFKGRSNRAEFLWYQLFHFVVFYALLFPILLLLSTGEDGPSSIAQLLSLLLFLGILGLVVPSYAVAVRRLHDTNRSAWWLLNPFNFIPILMKGTQGWNKYGDPFNADRNR